MRIRKRIPKPSLEIGAFLLLILGTNLELYAGHLRQAVGAATPMYRNTVQPTKEES